MRLSLVIPCYNEADNMPLLIERCSAFNDFSDIEIILVDNGSTDNTSKNFKSNKPKNMNIKMVRVEKNKGYGHGILTGLKVAKGEILGWTHADMQTDPKDALIGLDFFNQSSINTFVKGNRYGRPFFDNIFTIGMSIFETVILKQKMADINAQPTMFPREFYSTWVSAPEDFSLDLFAYYQAKVQGYNILRFKVKFEDRLFGKSKWNIGWASKWKFIQRTLKYSFELKRKEKNGNNFSS